MFKQFAFACLIVGCDSPGNSRIDRTVVTLAEFQEITAGMSHRQAASIIGDDGTEMATTTMPAVKGVMDEMVSKVYSWQNADGSNMNATFQNDKLMSKAQFGLK